MPSHATETDAADAPEPVPQTAKVGRWRLRPSLVAAVAFALGATTLLFLQSGDLFGRQREASAWVAHTHEILDVVTKLETDLSARNEARRLAETGDPEHLRQSGEEADNQMLADLVHAATGRVAAAEKSMLVDGIDAAHQAARRAISGLLAYGVLAGASCVLAVMLLAGRKHERHRLENLVRINAGLGDRVETLTSELFASEARFHMLAERASGLVSVVGTAGEPRYVSPAAVNLFGLRPDALLGHGVLERTLPEDHAAVEVFLRRLLAGGVEEDEAAFRAYRPDGSIIWIEAAARRLYDPMTGYPDGYIIVWRNVTVRKHSEALLRESEARYRLLAESTTDAIVCLDLDLRRTYVSPAYFTVFGQHPGAIIDGMWDVLIHPEDRLEVQQRLHRLVSGDNHHDRGTYRKQHSDGRWIWVEANLDLVCDGETGLPDSIICVLRDISERVAHAEALQRANMQLEHLTRHIAKARDAAQQANRAKSRFLATISHELRTPLAGIIGYSELLRLEGDLTPLQGAMVEKLLGAGRHLSEMINGLLDMSEVEADRMAMNAVKTDLPAVAAACLDLVRPAADAKGLVVSFTVAPDTPRDLMIDTTRLRQVLLNLLGNAVKFTVRGSVTLRLLPAADPQFVRIEIADTGRGISAEHRHLLFREFERLDVDEGNLAIDGTGLGLAISMKLVTLLGGRLGHEDTPSGGSLFWTEMPVGADYSKTVPVTSDVTEPPLVTDRLRILLVDDVLMNRDIGGSFLRSGGHEVVLAEGGAEAVAAAGREDFDVILMDVRMPEMDGLEATRLVRMLGGSRGRVPIVALTAQAFKEQVEECHVAGMDSHLAKPYTRETLLTAVAAAVLRGRERERAAAAAEKAPTSAASGPRRSWCRRGHYSQIEPQGHHLI